MTGIASLAMYTLDELRRPTEQLWEATRQEMPELPPLAPWPGDPHANWTDPDLVVSMACGWPLVTTLAGIVRVVGTFRFRTPTWTGDHYRSVIIVRDGDEPAADSGTTAAVNGLDSLSGWVSLVEWSNRTSSTDDTSGRRSWPGRVTLTGSHVASIAAVRSGAADVASIDAVTHAHLCRHRPESVAGTARIDAGPLVPCLPLVCPIDRDDDWVDRLRRALDIATGRASAAAEALMVDGFSPLDDSAYAGLADLRPDLRPDA